MASFAERDCTTGWLRPGTFASGRGDLPFTFCQSVLRKVRNGKKPPGCNSRKKQRFVLQSRPTSPVESKLTVQGHDSGCDTCGRESGKRRRQLGAGNASLYGATTLGTRIFKHAAKRRSARGFSLVELLVSVIILVILAAISVPTLLQAYRSYQLSDAASKLSGMMKTTRFSAIRKNTWIVCYVQQNGTSWTVWADLDKDGNVETTEPQILITGLVQMLDAGSVPPPDAIVTAVGPASPGINVLSPGNAAVRFDQRGARQFPGAPSVDVFYLGNTSIGDLGFRAIVLMPSGTVQVWRAGVGGPWTRVS